MIISINELCGNCDKHFDVDTEVTERAGYVEVTCPHCGYDAEIEYHPNMFVG